jgi:hypothetical protein
VIAAEHVPAAGGVPAESVGPVEHQMGEQRKMDRRGGRLDGHERGFCHAG